MADEDLVKLFGTTGQAEILFESCTLVSRNLVQLPASQASLFVSTYASTIVTYDLNGRPSSAPNSGATPSTMFEPVDVDIKETLG